MYIDNIIIFSRSPEEHVKHLKLILSLLEDSGITLSLGKCYFTQPTIYTLGHHISRLSLGTQEDKVADIKRLQFLEYLS